MENTIASSNTRWLVFYIMFRVKHWYSYLTIPIDIIGSLMTINIISVLTTTLSHYYYYVVSVYFNYYLLSLLPLKRANIYYILAFSPLYIVNISVAIPYLFMYIAPTCLYVVSNIDLSFSSSTLHFHISYLWK